LSQFSRVSASRSGSRWCAAAPDPPGSCRNAERRRIAQSSTPRILTDG
jgi:hypothetical protein